MRKLLMFAVAGLLFAQTPTPRPGKVTSQNTTTAVAGPLQELVCVSTADKLDPMTNLPTLRMDCTSGGYPALVAWLRIPLETAPGGALKLSFSRGEDVITYTVTKAAVDAAPNSWDVNANGATGSGYFQ